MKTSKAFAWLAVLLLMAGLMAGCRGEDGGSVPEEPDQMLQEEFQEPAEETTEPLPEYIELSTPYGALRYQGKWMDSMITTQTESEDSLQIDFSTRIGETEYALFSLILGNGEGSPVGQITDAQGDAHNVYLIFEEIVRYPELSEKEQDTLYAMQEDINYIIANLH